MIPNINTNKRGGFTLVELLVVIAIIALLMGILMPALSRAREYGKRAVCLNYQKQMATAWNMYADDNGDKLINGDAEEYGDWETSSDAYSCSPRGNHCNEKPWILKDWVPLGSPPLPVEVQKKQIMGGALFRFVKDIKAYRCPRAEAKEMRSFSIVDQMNVIVIGASVLNTNVPLFKDRQQIKKSFERIIFLDDGGAQGSTWGGWTVSFQTPPRWWDLPPARHGDGTTFSFADGHAEYHKWLESKTLECSRLRVVPSGGCTLTPATATKDLKWALTGAWGSETTSALTRTWP